MEKMFEDEKKISSKKKLQEVMEAKVQVLQPMVTKEMGKERLQMEMSLKEPEEG